MFHKGAVLIVMAIVAIAASGCAAGMGGPFSTGHYGGEGMLAGGAAGGITAAVITKGNPLGIAVGVVTGALTGAFIGGQVPKQAGIVERDMAIQAKQFALLQECRRDEWNKTEQAVRWAQTHGGKPADYYRPDYGRCDRAYGASAVIVQNQPQNINRPYYGQPNYGSAPPIYIPQFNINRY